MTKKRYYVHKHYLKENKVHDKICHRFMNIDETVDHMNIYYQKHVALKKENEQLKQENEELKKENQGIQNKVIKLLDFVEIKQCVTRTEIKKWWNND